MTKNYKKQKGGKVLGQGRDGCVVDPPFKCSTTGIKKYDDKISKLINISNATQEETNNFIREFKIGQQFSKFDPNHMMFLPGLEMCIMDDEDFTPAQNEDLDECGYKHWARETEVINIIMKKGVDFDKVVNNLTETQILKSIAYLCSTAMRYIYEMNTTLMDIKPENILFTHSDKHIYPVFIDFSEDFVLKGASGVSRFFSREYPGAYFVWPLEVNSAVGPKPNQVSRKDYEFFSKDIYHYHNINLTQGSNMNAINSINNFVKKSLRNADERRGLSDNMTVYMIGKSFLYALDERFKKQKLTKVRDILDAMVQEDVRKRAFLGDILLFIEEEYGIVEDEMFLRKSEVNNTVKKMFEGKEAQKIKNEKKTLTKNIKKSTKLAKSLSKKRSKKSTKNTKKTKSMNNKNSKKSITPGLTHILSKKYASYASLLKNKKTDSMLISMLPMVG